MIYFFNKQNFFLFYKSYFLETAGIKRVKILIINTKNSIAQLIHNSQNRLKNLYNSLGITEGNDKIRRIYKINFSSHDLLL
jgi:hypothetical protein